jgi:hypothetical protein
LFWNGRHVVRAPSVSGVTSLGDELSPTHLFFRANTPVRLSLWGLLGNRITVFIRSTVWSVVVQVFGRRNDRFSTHSDGRRPKSAKARNRGKLGTG